MDVKYPILLDSGLNPAKVLYPTKGSLTLRMCGVSDCQLTLPDSSIVGMHAWVKIFNQNGFVGYFRKTSNNRNIPSDNSITLQHGIDILQDSIWDAETDFSGTKTEFLTALLAKQTALIQGPGDNAPRAPWVLGSCADTSSYSKKIKYNDLLSLMQDLEDEGGAYYFSYNMATWPWTVSYLARPQNVASEFRLRRNMEKCVISENDSELCTRLILNVNGMVTDSSLGVDQNQSVYRVYNNTTAQATYGIIVKTMDIDVTQDTFPNGPFPEADAYAAKYLADRAAPINTIQIDGYELSKYTGDTWDEHEIATLCRVALPDYGTSIAERVASVQYPDLYGTPDRTVVTLSNATPKNLRENESFSKSVASTQRAVSRGGGSSRSTARQVENFVQHFEITDENANILEQAGMYLDAHGLLVYADDNVNMIGSRFNVQADKIGMVVGTNSGGNYIKAGEIALSINGQTGASKILLSADVIDIDGLVTALAAKNIQAASFTIYGSSAGNVNLAEAVRFVALSFDASTNTYTLKTIKMTDTQYTDIGTFSRAIASWTLGWSNGRFNVTANPQNQSCYTDIVQGTASWDGKTVAIPIEAVDSDNPNYQYATGRTVYATYTGSDPLSWSYGAVAQRNTSVSSNKTYEVSSGYSYYRFGVTVNNETKYIQVHVS